MMRSCLVYLVVISLVLGFGHSCKEDDPYIDNPIAAQEDLVQVNQNQSIEIDVLANDTNVPDSGVLTVSNSANATIEVIDPNGTPGNPADDLLRYVPAADFTGEDSFSYIICNDTQSNCASALVTVNVIPVSPVIFDINAVPYPKLSDYNFFDGVLADLTPNYGVVPFKPISTLFTDYALKKRFVWMPSGQIATYTNDHEVLNMPVGTILIKSFYYDNVLPDNTTRIIETRLMILKEEGWVFANYIWNNEQSEAFFDLAGGFTEVEWLQDGEPRSVNYRIPAESQCFTCHKAITDSTPIGIKPQNINNDYLYEFGSENQLQHLINMGYLEDNIPSNIYTVVNWEDESFSLDERVRSYFDINCAHCHADFKHCDYRPIRFEYIMTADPVNLGVCVEPDDYIPPYSKIVSPGDISDSVLWFRFSSTEEQYRMPLLGRQLVHEKALEMVENWINSLAVNCD